MGTTTTKPPHPSDALTNFRIDGTTPFGGRHETADELVKQATGLADLLGCAFIDADDNRSTSLVSGRRDISTAHAFEAISSLLGLSMFLRSGDGVSC
jgi:hypothetical protein